MTLRIFLVACFALTPLCPRVAAQVAAPPAETRAARAFDTARRAGAPALYAFLKPFPKGADLHMHLSGAIYAETFLKDASEDNLCVNTTTLSFDGHVLAAQIVHSPATPDQTLYDKLINAFSMRSFVPYAGWSGHDQFFATFDHFGGLKNFAGAWLDEVATRAAGQNEQYLEIMQTPSFNNAYAAEQKTGWPRDISEANYKSELAKLRDQLFANGLREDIAVDAKELADAKTSQRAIEGCRLPAGVETGSEPPFGFSNSHTILYEGSPACNVPIHWLYQVLRGFPPAQVFAQTLLGFELASADPDVVGINFVRAEDWRGPMAEYHTEMLMLDYLHSVYPKVHISLHAGELAPGMVPPAGLTFHIREAVELGHAERIGHGVDILHEDHPEELLKEMAAKHIMVEVNLTSNDVILGIKNAEHPLHTYMAAHVPAALSTDDEGVSRIDLTHEYVRAALEQNLSYVELKNMARTSLEHAFLGGESLWRSTDVFTVENSACAPPMAPHAELHPPIPCPTPFLNANEKAAQQFELERRFAAFEAAQR